MNYFKMQQDKKSQETRSLIIKIVSFTKTEPDIHPLITLGHSTFCNQKDKHKMKKCDKIKNVLRLACIERDSNTC